jgi:hypothetical protein
MLVVIALSCVSDSRRIGGVHLGLELVWLLQNEIINMRWNQSSVTIRESATEENFEAWEGVER